MDIHRATLHTLGAANYSASDFILISLMYATQHTSLNPDSAAYLNGSFSNGLIHHCHHADTQVQSALQVIPRHITQAAHHIKDGRDLPGATVDVGN